MTLDFDLAYFEQILEKVDAIVSLYENLGVSLPESEHRLVHQLLHHFQEIKFCYVSIFSTPNRLKTDEYDLSISLNTLKSFFDLIHSLEDFVPTNSFSNFAEYTDELSHLTDQWSRIKSLVDNPKFRVCEYLQSTLQALSSIIQLLTYLFENQQIDKIPEIFSQIQIIADSRNSSSLGPSLGIHIPIDEENKSSKFLEAVRDLAIVSLEEWLELMDISRFLSFLTNFRSNLESVVQIRSELRRPGLSPTPFLYYFPYPKGSPVARAKGNLKPILKPPSDPESIISPSDSEFDPRSFLEFLSKETNQEEE